MLVEDLPGAVTCAARQSALNLGGRDTSVPASLALPPSMMVNSTSLGGVPPRNQLVQIIPVALDGWPKQVLRDGPFIPWADQRDQT